MPPNQARLAISDVAAVNPPLSQAVAPDSMVSFVPMADVSDTGRRIGHQTRLQREVSKGYTPFEEGDVLFAKITPCMENGKGFHALGLVNGIGYGSTEFHVLRAMPGTNDRFLFHWSMSAELRKKAEAFMIGSAGQQRVQSNFFDHFTIPAIAETEQAEAALILDAADEAIERTEVLIDKLKAIKAGLLYDLLTRGLDDNGELRDPAKRPGEFHTTRLWMIPRQWEVVRLGDHAGVYGGKRLPGGHSYTSENTGLMYLRVIDFYQREPDFGTLVRIEQRTFDLLSRYEILAGNLYISIAGSLGYAGVFRPPTRVRAILTENAARIVPNSDFSPAFLALQLNGPLVQRQINQAKGISSGVPKLALCRIQNLNLALPSRPEQERIEQAAAIHDARIRSEEARLGKLHNIKAGLMQDLLTGRVLVKEGLKV